MKFYLVKTPAFVSRIYKKRMWHFDRKEKTIYLTFDDGPTSQVTDWTLKTLKKFNALATFFCIGKNVEKHPDIYQNIIAAGHAVGNHTFNHLNGWKTSNSRYFQNIKETDSLLNNSALFRPPYGKTTKSQVNLLRENGYSIVMWDVLSADFDLTITKEKCLQNVLQNTENGSIVVFHDSKKAEKKIKYVLPKILEYYSEKGFQFKKIEQV